MAGIVPLDWWCCLIILLVLVLLWILSAGNVVLPWWHNSELLLVSIFQWAGCQPWVTTGEPTKPPWTSVVGFLVQPHNQVVEAICQQWHERLRWWWWWWYSSDKHRNTWPLDNEVKCVTSSAEESYTRIRKNTSMENLQHFSGLSVTWLTHVHMLNMLSNNLPRYVGITRRNTRGSLLSVCRSAALLPVQFISRRPWSDRSIWCPCLSVCAYKLFAQKILPLHVGCLCFFSPW